MRLTQQEIRLITELRENGLDVTTVWDLVNSPGIPYADWEQILLRHLQVAEDDDLVEGIARALSHKHFAAALPHLITKFESVGSDSARWAIGNAISVMPWQGYEDRILTLAANDAFGAAREMIVWRLHRIKSASVEKLLIRLLGDRHLDAFAATSLAYCKTATALTALMTLDLSDRAPRAKKAVRRAIEKLSRKPLANST